MAAQDEQDVGAIAVVNNAEESQFEVRVGGQLAVAAYHLSDDTITFTHTEVPDALEGQGVAGRLARAALDHARANELRVVPMCAFIASYIKRHPEYQELVSTSW
jgi:uncharacterized protein